MAYNAPLKIVKVFILCGLVLMLMSCSSGTTAPVSNAWDEVHTTQTQYTVQPGDTLYSIAWRFHLNDEALAQLNHLPKPYAVRIGQHLRLTAVQFDDTPEPTAHNMSVTKIDAMPHFAPVPTHSIPVKANEQTLANKASTRMQRPTSTAAMHQNGQGSWPWPVRGKIRTTYGQEGCKGLDIEVPIGTKIKAVQSGTVVYAGSNLHGYGQLLIIKQKNDLITAYAHNKQLLISEGAHVATGQTIALSGDSEAPLPMLHFEVRKLGKTVDPLQYLSA